MGIKVPNGKGGYNTVEVSEVLDQVKEFDVELKRNSMSSGDWVQHLDDKFVLLSVEAMVDLPREVLAHCELTIECDEKPMHRIGLHLITVHDTVLEARMRHLEQLVDGILTTELSEESESSIEARMALRKMVLVRLGYVPGTVVDHRALTKPLLWKERQQGRVVVRCDERGPEGTVPCRITLRGVRKRSVN